MRKRDKPLRTYGKRSASTSTTETRSEPPAKRIRVDETPSISSRLPRNKSCTADDDAATSTVEQEAEAQTRAEQLRKPSILNYFKRVPPIPTAPPTKTVGDGGTLRERTASPAVSGRRKPRLLRIRATSTPIDDSAAETDDKESVTNSTDVRHPLTDQGGGLQNQQRESASPVDAKRKQGSKGKASPTVQTTLNISAQAAFSECKVCDTVWNPLYPDDVKYHSKRHAAVLRAKKRGVDEL